jgi:hypothetical protein
MAFRMLFVYLYITLPLCKYSTHSKQKKKELLYKIYKHNNETHDKMKSLILSRTKLGPFISCCGHAMHIRAQGDNLPLQPWSMG